MENLFFYREILTKGIFTMTINMSYTRNQNTVEAVKEILSDMKEFKTIDGYMSSLSEEEKIAHREFFFLIKELTDLHRKY